MSSRVAVVTGGARGIGRGIVEALARSGCDVVLNWSTSGERAADTARSVESLGRRVVTVQGDVRDESTSETLVDAAMALGGLDVWVNNAGISTLARIVETGADDFARMIAVNLMGTFFGLRAAARAMTAAGTGGRIINVASDLGVQAAPLLGAYSATKFGVVGLTQAAALELGAHGITVNAIGPGTSETDMVLAERESESRITSRSPEQVRSAYLEAIPVGRFCVPEDAGALVAWLASGESSYVTGQVLLVNGGSIVH